MASRRLLLRRNALPIAAGALTAGALFLPRSTLYAESPSLHTSKKPIYDDLPTTTSAPTSPNPTRENPSEPSGFFATRPDPSSPSSTASTAPTPTDRLTGYMRTARLGLYNLTTRTEATANDLFTRFLHLESSFTRTVASLAPPPTANEQLVPGLIYVLVATLAGSIVSRNRGILLRMAVPVAFGVGAGYAVIPVTMRNVGDLAWRYEERYPVVRDAHLRVRERAETVWQTGKSHTAMSVHMAEDKLDQARKGVEDWVKQGK